LLLCVVLNSTHAKYGIDLTIPLTEAEWTSKITAENVEFALVRVVKHNGEIDGTGIRNLRRAQAAGITELSGYMYPCVPTSYYISNQLKSTCLSPSEQLEALKNKLEENVATLTSYTTSSWPPTAAPTNAPTFGSLPSPAPSFAPSAAPTTAAPTLAPTQQPTAAPTIAPTILVAITPHPTAIPTASPTNTASPTINFPTSAPTNLPGQQQLVLKRIFLMVEDESPPRYFDADQTVNIAYFQELATKAWEYGFQLGVYTTLRYWSELMETDSGQTAHFSRDNIPLWVPRFDSIQSMQFFVPFGGWNHIYMKQYKGASSAARRQDVTWRVNDNWIAANYDLSGLNSTTVDPIP